MAYFGATNVFWVMFSIAKGLFSRSIFEYLFLNGISSVFFLEQLLLSSMMPVRGAGPLSATETLQNQVVKFQVNLGNIALTQGSNMRGRWNLTSQSTYNTNLITSRFALLTSAMHCVTVRTYTVQ